ncbi:MAG: hypothetical protein M0Q12_01145 [Synergistaceae bacterium]|jgi:hypothetical protein|nr:hypothetical protein [Synergistaceae bacterium]
MKSLQSSDGCKVVTIEDETTLKLFRKKWLVGWVSRFVCKKIGTMNYYLCEAFLKRDKVDLILRKDGFIDLLESFDSNIGTVKVYTTSQERADQVAYEYFTKTYPEYSNRIIIL